MHFRGGWCAVPAGYYAVDAKAETAMHGTWKKGPGTELFAALEKVPSLGLPPFALSLTA
jgi:4-alpha-glucanotransferase